MNEFFILGLPRSRTAWLANFFTVGDLFCWHEGLSECFSVNMYQNKVRNCGDSTTSACLIDLNLLFKDPKIIIIETPLDKAIKFCDSTYGTDSKEVIAFLHESLRKKDGLKIRFNEIDERLPEIWDYVTDKPFDFRRAEMLKKLNIQTNVLQYDERIFKFFMDDYNRGEF